MVDGPPRSRNGGSSAKRKNTDHASSGGWFNRLVGLGVILLSVAMTVIAVTLVYYAPEFFELGWALVDAINNVGRAITQSGPGGA